MKYNNSKPISVIMATRNNAQFLETTIQSIRVQTHSNFEFVIVDDASTDDTAQILQHYSTLDKRIRILTNKTNVGVAESRNRCLDSAQHRWIAIMDGDDASHPQRLARQIAHSDAFSSKLVGVGMFWCNSNLKPVRMTLYPKTTNEIRSTIFKRSPFCLPSCMFDRDAMPEKRYNKSLQPCEDLDFFLEVIFNNECSNVQEPLYYYRTYNQQTSSIRGNEMLFRTLYLRWKAIVEFNAQPRPLDYVYNLAHLITVVIPAPVRMKLWGKINARVIQGPRP